MSKKRTLKQEKKIQRILIALTVIALILISFFRFGPIGLFIDRTLRYVAGARRDLVYLGGLLYALASLFTDMPVKKLKTKIMFGFSYGFIFLLSTYLATQKDEIGFAVLSAWFKNSIFIFSERFADKGGLIGVTMYSLLSALFDRVGTLIIMILLVVAVVLLNLDYSSLSLPKRKAKPVLEKKISRKAETYAEEDAEQRRSIFLKSDETDTFEERETVKKTRISRKKEIQQEVKEENVPQRRVPEQILRHSGPYRLPDVSLLDPLQAKNRSNANQQAASLKGKRLIEILNQFGIGSQLIATHIGPAVTKFELKPESNIKVSKISSLQDNIKMELSAKELRIEAPIPGRNAVGVEIPNVEMIPVKMMEMMKEIPSDKINRKLLFPLGKDLMGKAVYAEMNKMPHLLIAGATGSGKSVCVNSIIMSFLLRTSPEEVKLVLIDPKKVEFTPYHKVPHLLTPVITDPSDAARALNVIVQMMVERYDIFSNAGVRNIQSYMELMESKPEAGYKPMPLVVVIIDELADLMLVAGKEVEASIQRITQLARAAGIHLIVATQRPSTDVITGIIKANIPSRIAFAVSSGIDSRTILDSVGAERLLGYGDMLFYPTSEPNFTRIQGVFVSDDEIRRVTDFVSSQQSPQFDTAFDALGADDKEGGNGMSSDPIFEEVKDYVMETGRASTSSIQRRFGLGYNRAARLIDQLEEMGIVGPANGSKPRDVYVRK